MSTNVGQTTGGALAYHWTILQVTSSLSNAKSPHHDVVGRALRAQKHVGVHTVFPLRGSPKMARHLWECQVQSHEWQPAQQCLHTWVSTHVGPRLSYVSQQWNSAVLKQWSAAIATPSLWAADMGLAGLHGTGTEFIRQVLSEAQKA